jgi:hypothetical protein
MGAIGGAGSGSVPLRGRRRAGEIHGIRSKTLNTENAEKRGERTLFFTENFVIGVLVLSSFFSVPSVLKSVFSRAG